MTGPSFAISANVHGPIVKSVFRFESSGEKLLSINLGDPTGYAHVSLIVTDEQWRAIVRDTDAEIARVDAAERAEQDDDYAIRCPEGCGETFNGDDRGALLTEHVFAKHPEAVAR
jgi:hypothetical protein